MHSCIPSFLPSFIHSFIYAFMHSCIHSFIHSFNYSFIHLSFIHSFMHSFLHPFIHSFILSFIHSFIHSFFLSRPRVLVLFNPKFHSSPLCAGELHLVGRGRRDRGARLRRRQAEDLPTRSRRSIPDGRARVRWSKVVGQCVLRDLVKYKSTRLPTKHPNSPTANESNVSPYTAMQ